MIDAIHKKYTWYLGKAFQNLKYVFAFKCNRCSEISSENCYLFSDTLPGYHIWFNGTALIKKIMICLVKNTVNNFIIFPLNTIVVLYIQYFIKYVYNYQ